MSRFSNASLVVGDGSVARQPCVCICVVRFLNRESIFVLLDKTGSDSLV